MAFLFCLVHSIPLWELGPADGNLGPFLAVGCSEYSYCGPFLYMSFYGHMFSFLLDKFLDMELLSHRIRCMFSFIKQL